MKKLLFTLMCLSAWSSTPTYADGNQINLDLRKEISQKASYYH
jgi:hypothetical protein